MKERILSVFVLVSAFAIAAQGQDFKMETLKPKKPIICYADRENHATRVPAPEEFEKWRRSVAGRTKTANIIVTYNGFSAQAQTAFQFAVDIWETILVSDVPIRVIANWSALEEGVLGSAIYGAAYRNFPGAQKLNTWYPSALAEKMAGVELNDPSEPDIFANFSSAINWHYSTSGTPSPNQYDLVTVVLHELGHGLGFVDSYSVQGEVGVVGVQDTGFPIIFDLHLENAADQNIFQSFDNNTAELKNQLTSGQVFYNSPSVIDVNTTRARIYAPTTFDGGSSIAHLNEATYPSGNQNSLMTPQVAAQEVNHDPGPITKALFSDMGWTFTRIEHEPLLDTENESGPYIVKATITSDDGPVQNVKLFYSNGGALTEVNMTATGTPDEFQATIPAAAGPGTYQYYISATDDSDRVYTNPGKIVSTDDEEQAFFSFKTGPDNESPEITHQPVTFIQDNATELLIEAIVTDNLGLDEVLLEYKINDVAQAPIEMELTNTLDNIYSATINIASLVIGDVIEYRIKATDSSIAGNTTVEPQDEFHSVAVVGLDATQDSYANDFNSSSDDFFGDGFSIITPNGFSNGAIHSQHPYPEGNTFPNQVLNFVYQLKIPIRVAASNSTIKFDEVVLVEPGADGSVFGDEDFFDYVVVEGSTDGGETWTPIEDGYDATEHSAWLNEFNSGFEGNNSTGTGDESLYRPREMNLLNEFNEGDEVVIRFRLFSDPFANGWGWAIDNLRIQYDETGPLISHDFIDYVQPNAVVLPITIGIADPSDVETLQLDYKLDDSSIETHNFTVSSIFNEYNLELAIDGLQTNSVISYRIRATDANGNETVIPSEGFLTVKAVVFSEPVAQYVTDFNTANNDFVGNYFTQSKPTGFASTAIHTTHPYPTGFGENQTSSFQYTLLKPITPDPSNPYIQFNEIAIVEGQSSSAVFGTEAFNDYVVVEGSTDNGATWTPFEDGYDCVGVPTWTTAFNNGSNGVASMYRRRTINMLSSGEFTSGDEILVRFRLYSDEENNGWGWSIDDLSIQGPVTGIEDPFNKSLQVFPNPVSAVLNVKMSAVNNEQVSFSILNLQGQVIKTAEVISQDGVAEKQFESLTLPSGLYFMKAQIGDKVVTQKFIKKSE